MLLTNKKLPAQADDDYFENEKSQEQTWMKEIMNSILKEEE